MTEDELLTGLTEAATILGWTWTHIRRSDGITMGNAGLPDIIATKADRHLILAWELKSPRGQLTEDQWAWGLALGNAPCVDWRVIRPADYDAALAVLAGEDPRVAFGSIVTRTAVD